MDNVLVRESVRSQFVAAIDMLDNAIAAFPTEVWGDRSREPQPWYLAFHTLFWLDLYLHGPIEGFEPPPPFTLVELDPAGLLPERVYTQAELRDYAAHCRRRCQETLDALTDATAAETFHFGWGMANRLELHLYNLRHVQHGAAQLNQVLRRATRSAPRWVAQGQGRNAP